MSDIDPHHVQQAAEQATGVWQWLAAAMAATLGVAGRFMLKDQNTRLKTVEECQRLMATKEDIKDVHKKIENLSRENTDRIISIIEKLPKG